MPAEEVTQSMRIRRLQIYGKEMANRNRFLRGIRIDVLEERPSRCWRAGNSAGPSKRSRRTELHGFSNDADGEFQTPNADAVSRRETETNVEKGAPDLRQTYEQK